MKGRNLDDLLFIVIIKKTNTTEKGFKKAYSFKDFKLCMLKEGRGPKEEGKF